MSELNPEQPFPGTGARFDLRRRFDAGLGRAVQRILNPADQAAPGNDTAPRPIEIGADEEQTLLGSVDTYLERGRDLHRWWRTVFPDGFEDRFDLSRSFDRADSSFGFFDTAPVDGRRMAVMGNYQRMFYDRPKPFAGSSEERGDWIRRQMREFVLRYFMRVSDFRGPEVVASSEGAQPSPWLRPISLCRPRRDPTIGFGFSQLYFKTKTGEIGRFAPDERYRIVDLRQLKDRYEWIVVKVRIFDFAFSYQPFGEAGPSLTLPLAEESYLALSADLISDSTTPNQAAGTGIQGRYGIGYAFIQNPEQGLLGYGPGEFEAALEIIDFLVDDDGRVSVGMIFVSNRPRRILNLSLDPTDWGTRMAELANGGRRPRWLDPFDALARRSPFRRLGFDPIYSGIDAANLLTGGLAQRLLCVSRRTLEEEFLIKHFEQHYETVATSLHTWRRIPDWLDTEALPESARRGI